VVALVQTGAGLQTLVTRDGVHWAREGAVPGSDQYTMARLQFVDGEDGFAWNSETLWRTVDGGQHWNVASEASFTSVAFESPSLGLSTVNGRVLVTRDGGLAWSPVLPTSGIRFTSVSYAGSATWFTSGVTASGPIVERSLDGGVRWTVVLSGRTAPGFAAAYRAYLATMNAGATFQPSLTGGSTVAFTSPTTGWLAAFDGGWLSTGMFYTDDGGQHWTYAWGNAGCAMSCNAMGRGLDPAAFLGPATAWRFDRRQIQQSVNAGVTWMPGTPLPFGEGSDAAVAQTSFISSQIGWIASNDGIFRTEDGGRLWTRQWPLSPGPAALAAFTRDGYGWMTAQAAPSTLWITTDAGRTWSPSAHRFGSIAALDIWAPGNGMVVSDQGSAWKTTNGGRTWVSVPVPRRVVAGGGMVFTVGYNSARRGWIYDGQSLWVTSRASRGWHRVAAFPTGVFVADFVTPQAGWALDGRKYGPIRDWTVRILRTADGGRRWVTVGRIPPADNPLSLDFVTAARGFVLTRTGVLATRNGGRTWSLIRLPGAYPKSLTVVGRRLYLVTLAGAILTSASGGRNWEVLPNS
ncbi:MAG: YCF48-related protein, partial [Clostridia bacterium]